MKKFMFYFTLGLLLIDTSLTRTHDLTKIFILYGPSSESLKAALLLKQQFIRKSQIPKQFMELKKTSNCQKLPKQMQSWDWYLVMCVDQKKKINLLRFRRESFYAVFSPYWKS